jgi:hypothetical protein
MGRKRRPGWATGGGLVSAGGMILTGARVLMSLASTSGFAEIVAKGSVFLVFGALAFGAVHLGLYIDQLPG